MLKEFLGIVIEKRDGTIKIIEMNQKQTMSSATTRKEKREKDLKLRAIRDASFSRKWNNGSYPIPRSSTKKGFLTEPRSVCDQIVHSSQSMTENNEDSSSA